MINIRCCCFNSLVVVVVAAVGAHNAAAAAREPLLQWRRCRNSFLIRPESDAPPLPLARCSRRAGAEATPPPPAEAEAEAFTAVALRRADCCCSGSSAPPFSMLTTGQSRHSQPASQLAKADSTCCVSSRPAEQCRLRPTGGQHFRVAVHSRRRRRTERRKKRTASFPMPTLPPLN